MSVFARRADRLEAGVVERGLDALLVSNLINVRYLTGFPGTNGLCLAAPGRRDFVTDFRYIELARGEITDWELRKGKRDLFESIIELASAGANGAVRLGFDDANLTVRQHARLLELGSDKLELVPAGGLVERLREVKDAAELRLIAQAAALADELYGWLIGEHGLAGHEERDVALALERRALDLGTRMSFPPIVAAADNGALPHAQPRAVEIARDTLVVVDMGCEIDGYCSDCTRTFSTGQLSEEMVGCYELVRAAQAAALEVVRAGVTGEAVDAAARDMIADAGHAEGFGHGTGHGVGLEVHEQPRLAPKVDKPLEPSNVVTVEPGVYLPGRFGVRIEDLVAVTQEGCQVLTAVSKELTVV